jgi:hypothetical protein
VLLWKHERSRGTLSVIYEHLFERVTQMSFDLVYFMVFNTTFKSISVISWQSVLLVEETRVLTETDIQSLKEKRTKTQTKVHVTLHRILKIEHHESHLKNSVNSVDLEG